MRTKTQTNPQNSNCVPYPIFREFGVVLHSARGALSPLPLLCDDVNSTSSSPRTKNRPPSNKWLFVVWSPIKSEISHVIWRHVVTTIPRSSGDAAATPLDVAHPPNPSTRTGKLKDSLT